MHDRNLCSYLAIMNRILIPVMSDASVARGARVSWPLPPPGGGGGFSADRCRRCRVHQELCGLTKQHLQAANRAHLLTKLIELGLFEVRAAAPCCMSVCPSVHLSAHLFLRPTEVGRMCCMAPVCLSVREHQLCFKSISRPTPSARLSDSFPAPGSQDTRRGRVCLLSQR
jgi:hypothetical protein